MPLLNTKRSTSMAKSFSVVLRISETGVSARALAGAAACAATISQATRGWIRPPPSPAISDHVDLCEGKVLAFDADAALATPGLEPDDA
jgi:hypothetical protein